MGIASSLYSGVSGLTTNSNAMSVIGNNIANSNTVGFKSSRTIFADL
ncbi:MAG: flagellar hook protein FlgE, partial [Deltaproteobacteria bacterium]